jgi:histone demethylase JARID1
VNNGPPIKREGENGTSTPKPVSEHAFVSTPVNGQPGESVKRAISQENGSQSDNGDDDGGSGRRSKRLKKGISPCALETGLV